jgi:excisionase family DNA binding protein
MSRVVIAPDERTAFFTPDDLARYLRVSIRTVRQILSDGKVPSYTFEGARRIAAADVDSYVAQCRAENAKRVAA